MAMLRHASVRPLALERDWSSVIGLQECEGRSVSAYATSSRPLVADPNESRAFDLMMTKLRMDRGGDRFRGRYRLLQTSTLMAAKHFPDGYFDWVYLDATHTYADSKLDLEA